MVNSRWLLLRSHYTEFSSQMYLGNDGDDDNDTENTESAYRHDRNTQIK